MRHLVADMMCEVWQQCVCCIFRHNGDCAHEITALAISAVPSLITCVNSLPAGILNTLLTTLLETTKVLDLQNILTLNDYTRTSKFNQLKNMSVLLIG